MYERFEQLLLEKAISAYKVSKETGISTATLTSWKQGKYTPKPDKLQKIADYFGVQIDWLTGDSEYKTKKEMFDAWDTMYNKDENLAEKVRKIEKGIRIPVLGNVAAGVPIEVMEDVLDWEEIPEDMASKGNTSD